MALKSPLTRIVRRYLHWNYATYFVFYDGTHSGRSVAWLARLVRDQEVGSSNLPAPTYFPYTSSEAKLPHATTLVAPKTCLIGSRNTTPAKTSLHVTGSRGISFIRRYSPHDRRLRRKNDRSRLEVQRGILQIYQSPVPASAWRLRRQGRESLLPKASPREKESR